MSELSTNELVEIKKVFDHYDTDSNEIIDMKEFCHMVDDLDGNISPDGKIIVFDKIDGNCTGMINFEKFTKCWKELD